MKSPPLALDRLPPRMPPVVAASLLGVGLLGGCTGTWIDNRPDYTHVNLAQGVTRVCYGEPCTVTLQLPPGEGQYTVQANGAVLGTFAAGEPVDLGAFGRQDSPVTFRVEGLERSAAVLYVLERHQY